MAVTLSALNYASTANQSSLSITVPASTNSDSTQLIVVNAKTETNVTVTGFTEVNHVDYGDGTARLTVMKREGQYSSGSHTVNFGGTPSTADVMAFCAQNGKIDASAFSYIGWAEDPNGPYGPSVTAARNDTIWLQVVGTCAWGRNFVPPTGVTALSSTSNGNWDIATAVGYKTVNSGSTGNGGAWITKDMETGLSSGDDCYGASLAISTPASPATVTVNGGGELPYTYATTSISATPATVTTLGSTTITIVDQNSLPVQGATASSSNAAVATVTSPSNAAGQVVINAITGGTATITIDYDDSMSSAQQDTVSVSTASNTLTMTNHLKRVVAEAIARAPSGGKRAAGISALSSFIGSSYRVILRRTDGTPANKLILVGSGSLPTGTSCVLTNSNVASINTITDTDLDVGTYVLRITNSAMTEYVEGSAGRSSTNFVLVNDIDDALGAVVNTITLTLPASLDAGAATGTPIAFEDARTVFNTNPTKTWQQLHIQWPLLTLGMQPHTNSTYANLGYAEDLILFGAVSAADPTYADRNSTGTKLARVTDPKNASRTVNLHRLHKDGRFRSESGYTGDLSTVTWRSSMQATNFNPVDYGSLMYGDTFVFAIDILLASDSICTAWGDGIYLWDFHHWSGGQGSGTPFFAGIDHFQDDNWAAPRFSFRVGYNPDDYGYGSINGAIRPGSGHNYEVALWQTTDLASMRANWHTFIVRGKISANLADNPFVECWLRIGNGALTQVANLQGHPFGFRYNSYLGYNQYWPQVQLYKYTQNFGGSVNSRSYYNRGMYVWRDGAGTPLITVDNALATIDALGA